jgi:DNA-binding beta-propeller fold protein YncE
VGNGGNGGFAQFIFATTDGTISAWDTGPTAFIQVTTAGAHYTGLAINAAQTQLYAANDVGTGSIDVFNSSWAPVHLGPNAFTDPAVGALVPFNVQDIDGKVYVTYAPGGPPPNREMAPLGGRGRGDFR